VSAHSNVEKILASIASAASRPLQHRLIGIEKESLRVAGDGTLAKTTHPRALGSALTHPYITTDFSEVLLEFVTPPLPTATQVIDFLEEIHGCVYRHIGNELLWCASMPCTIRDGTDIPLAYYGSSNIGRMKTIYRRGLAYRYGRFMQTIAGVHFNYSLENTFWQWFYQYLGSSESMSDFRSERYMGLIRNFLRVAWMIPYLFGASPAISRTFVAEGAHDLRPFDDTTLFAPYATSLRMGDIGYQNNREADIGVKACYDNLKQYVHCLGRAVGSEYQPYRLLGIKEGGEYRQLNANILQIENEYYSTIRPKHQSSGDEMPLAILRSKGVQYVELRSLDIDIIENTGVGVEQLCFLEALMIFCLLDDSPLIDTQHWEMIDGNEIKVAQEGRYPNLELNYFGNKRKLKEWGIDVCMRMQAVCDLLDSQCNNDIYRSALRKQMEKFHHPDLCPSALMLEEMRQNQQSFVELIRHYATQKKGYFMQYPVDTEHLRQFEQTAQNSIDEQKRLEKTDKLSLDQYIENYYAQLNDLNYEL